MKGIGLSPAIQNIPKKLAYWLHASFDASDQGFANGQVLDDLGEGIQAGELNIVEVDGTLAIVSNECAFTAQGTPGWGDLGFYSQAITRILGKALLFTINIDDVTQDVAYQGWHQGAGIALGDKLHEWRLRTSLIRIQEIGGLDIDLAVSVNSTDYELVLVLGGYNSDSVPWRSGEPASSYLYGAAWYIRGGAFADLTLLWRTVLDNTATLYAAFSNYDAAGTIDDFRVPDKSLAAVLQPNNLSLYASAGELSDYTPELGSAWTEDIGDWDTAGGTLTATALGIAAFTGLADCIYDTEITMPGAGNVAGGLVLRGSDYTGGSEDYWYVKCTPAVVGNDFEIIEYTGGVVTQRAVIDVDFAAGTAYDIRAICDGQTIDALADGGDKISYGSAAAGETDTDFGLRDEGNGNMTFDKTALYPRTSSIFDATLDAV